MARVHKNEFGCVVVELSEDEFELWQEGDERHNIVYAITRNTSDAPASTART